jgi:hypothetical protein
MGKMGGLTYGRGCTVRYHGGKEGSCERFVEAIAEHAYRGDDVACWDE